MDTTHLETLFGVTNFGRKRAALRKELREVGSLQAQLQQPDKSPTFAAQFEALREVLDQLANEPVGENLKGPDDVGRFFRQKLRHETVETFWVVALDARLRVIGADCIARGTLTACLVHPREVFSFAITHKAAQLILVHNHPSGDPTPSEEDRVLTERLRSAGALLGITLIDHVVVAREGCRSV